MTRRVGIEIEIEGPVITAGLETAAYGVDTSFLRSADGTRYILPGTLIKGVVRHMLIAFAAAAPDKLAPNKIIEWFGAPSGDVESGSGAAFEPDRGLLRFDDFSLPVSKAAPHITRIQLEPETGSVRRGMLQVLETPFGYGVRAVFAGVVTIVADETTAATIIDWIHKALRLAPALGGAKSAGFGHITAVRQVAAAPLAIAHPVRATLTPGPGTHRAGYALAFDQPVLVGSRTLSGNLFRGSEEIPGGAVKGAIARAIAAAGRTDELAVALDRLIIRHAKPVLQGTAARPRVIPLSVYSAEAASGELRLEDALDEDPEVFARVFSRTVTFPTDWKPHGAAVAQARQRFGQNAELGFDIRTRTAITPDRTAATSLLFSRLAIDPAGHVWLGEAERGDADAAAFLAILEVMAQGLSGIGKTGAPAAVVFTTPSQRPAPQPLAAAGGRKAWRIILETDALLHGPGEALNHADQVDPSARLDAQYRDYFAAVINARAGRAIVDAGTLKLRFFASQRWVGGYQARRFPAFHDRYYPHLLTEAGSVFRLEAPDVADQAIASFVTHGLPLPASVTSRDFEYQRSPFVPQNGYGEVSISNTPLVAAGQK